MRKLLAVALLGATIIGCEENEDIRNPSLKEQILHILATEGYPAEITEDGVLIMGGFESMESAVNKINGILDEIGYSNAKFDSLEKSNEIFLNGRTTRLDCSAGPVYDIGDGVVCQNFLCIGDTSYSILDWYECDEHNCYTLLTTCVD